MTIKGKLGEGYTEIIFASSEQNNHVPQLRIGRLIKKNKGIIKIRYTLGKIVKYIQDTQRLSNPQRSDFEIHLLDNPQQRIVDVQRSDETRKIEF